MTAKDLQTHHLFSIDENTHILYTYTEATHFGTVCYLLLSSSWALETTFIRSNGEIRSISVSIANYYVSDADVTVNCLYVELFKIYTSVSLRLKYPKYKLPLIHT
jgi:hypothetical protein